MKRVHIYLFLAIAVLFFASCEKEQSTNPSNEPLPIFRGYMQFSTDVSTRADLATNMRGRNFGVFGYEYNTTTTWSYAKANTTPQTFYNQKVECDSSGNCTYDVDGTQGGNQFKRWEDKHYSFFAYHPYGGSGIAFSGQNDVNTPMLTYTYGWYSNTSDYIDATANEHIFDLMTAEHVDADGSTNVGLNFKHRMFAIEVLANNYNEHTYEYDTVPVYAKDANGNYILDANGNKVPSTDAQGNPIFEDVIRKDADGNNVIAPGGDQSKEVGMVTIKLDSLRYNTMTIPMSMASGETKPVYSGPAKPFSREFVISMNKVRIPAYNETIIDEYGERGGGIPTSISKLGSDGGGYLMLIPQDAIQGAEYNIRFSIDWLGKPADSDDIKTTFDATINFEPGRLYQLIINFVGSGITIALIEAGSWDPLTVEHTFE